MKIIKTKSVLRGLSYLLICFYLLASDSAMAERGSFSNFALGIINDNYTGTREMGIDGYYIGPDDFLTVSYFLRANTGHWRFALVDNTLTSRKFRFRYDLIQVSAARSYMYRNIDLQPRFGIVLKGQYGGESIQNWFHRVRDLPEVFLPYSDSGLAVIFAGLGSSRRETVCIRPGSITAALELRLLTGVLPSRLTPMLGYQTAFWNQRVQLESLVGCRVYLNEVDQFSEFIRPGIFFGFNLKTRIYKDFYFDYGLSFFPAQNLQNDPLYMDKRHTYLPQISMVLSWNTSNSKLVDLLDY
ncbi:MAG: hypothetical protein K9N35_10675 [Candidatus Marinimicrobia bacterium]|nr:hypothetical protein [Candidatus Neomarinimicrobiota bacterium]